ncbi:OpgC domain-containing protein [Kaistia dalseonensis]|uniref:OpgC domain-containing protein n=1 Tax=Kaistia dalseonensis TaxID=410840 RepID=A0ABU0HB25_9HYPH|nr:OpgC domain-containing protein [Kaistia dalseonensis]MCX5496891.1 OpgC domain-containing protein [Kaistia dalseonensis]MDQ0439517.1 hypothetical protein [Kaistia dalseonensis]
MPRDYRIDFFRGLALISIFVNHIPGNFFSNFTHRNFGLSDAAEVFVLLAGMSAALAYFPRFVSGQGPRAVGLVAKRIGTLYIAQLSSILIGFSIYAIASIWLQDPGLMLPDERRWIVEVPIKALAGLGLLTYQTGNFNILPMYIGMMALLPAIMLIARFRLSLAVAASFLLWLVANIFRINLPNFPSSGGWYFNPLTWQFLFTIGFVGGVMLRRGDRLYYSKTLYWLALAYLVASAVLVVGHYWDSFPPLPQWVWLSGFDKTWVGAFRILHVVSIGYVVVFSPIPAMLKRWLYAENWIVRLGRNTLPVFWLSTVLAVTGHILRESVFGLPNDPTFTATGIMLDLLLIPVGLAIMFGLAAFLDWTKASASRPSAAEEGARGRSNAGMVPAE